MTLCDLIRLAKKHCALLVALPLVFAVAFGAYAKIASREVYTAQSSLYLQAFQGASENEPEIAIESSQLLVDDAVTLLQSKRVEHAASEALGLDSLGSCSISVSRVSNSRVIRISVTGDDAQTTVDVANALAENGITVVREYMKADLLRLVDPAEAPSSAGGTSVPLYVGIGLAGGLLLALAIMFVSRYFEMASCGDGAQRPVDGFAADVNGQDE